MGLFGPSRADMLEQQLHLEHEERLLLINYVRNIERLCSRELSHVVETLQAAHQAVREDAYRDFNGEVNFSRRPDFTRYALAMQRRNFEVTIADPNMRIR